MIENQNFKNIPILNTLRFFAAFSVCIFHFVCTTNGLIYNKFILSIFDYGKYGVQMFFVISGFIIPWSMYHSKYKLKNIFEFILKRLLRIEPTYIVSIILILFVALLLRFFLNIYDVKFSIIQITLHLGYLIPFFNNYHWLNEAYWTLAIEFQYYLLLSLLFPLFVRSNKLYRYLLYLLFILTSINSDGAFLAHWLTIFLMGIILFLKMVEKIKIVEFITMIVFLSFWTIYFQGIGSCLFSITTVFLIYFFNETNLTIPSFLGNFSYSLYLIHGPTGAILINLFSPYATSIWQKIILLLSSIIITYILAWIMYKTIEKPSKILSSKIKFRE